MRGHAGTDGPPNGNFTLPGLAADITAVLDSLEIHKVHVVGASAGGIVSLQFAHDFPDRTHSLSLVASTPKLAQMGAAIDSSVWRRTLEEQGTKAWLRLTPKSGLAQTLSLNSLNGTRLLAKDSCGDGFGLARVPTVSGPYPFASSDLCADPNHGVHTRPNHALKRPTPMAENIPNACLKTFEMWVKMKVEIPDTLARTVMEILLGRSKLTKRRLLGHVSVAITVDIHAPTLPFKMFVSARESRPVTRLNENRPLWKENTRVDEGC
ncbi:MAG: hypothetical protein Ct9H300mP11_05800 [Chloroflexota bacterium]|nr:MAG: hypothetical protein Ct9H300mP11_05800 [Chloroflexota bacterium]